ncbi:MAG: protein-L-isoaspartate O-methyltransferase, partial [Gammaproteobacteria bacterium]|nr:protein-L-isoaspartate O-methyltransferase [Gammaproteobacteria bacterium]
SVERLGLLQQRARQVLSGLGVRNVRFRHADGGWGWPQHAPYAGILVGAAPAQVPPALLEQLAVGGRMVIPVGNHNEQDLVLITRRNETDYTRKLLERVNFVPLVEGAE